MADEEVKIRITEERQGNAIREAKKDLENLNREQKAAASQPATPPPATPGRPRQPREYHSLESLEKKYQTQDAAEAAKAEERLKPKNALKAEIQRGKEAIASTKLEEEQARAAGRTGEADTLAKEVKELEVAVALQQKLGVSQDEALRMARASISAKAKIAQQTQAELERQRKVTEEQKRQAVYEKANITGAGRVMQFGQQALFGSPTVSSMMTMGRGLGGVGAAVGTAAIAAAIVAAVKSVLGAQFDADKKDISLTNRLREDRSRDERGLVRQTGIFGSSSAAVSSSVETKEEIEARMAHREEIRHQAKLSKLNPLRWMDDAFGTENWKRGAGGLGWWKSDGARSVEENEERIRQLERRREEERTAAREKFLNEDGGLELNIARNRARHDLPGLKAAREAEGALIFMKEYKRSAAESGDDALASESANIKVKEWQRDLKLRAASGMVDARSGGADIARAAEVASMALPDQDKLQRGIEAMHQTLKTQLDRLNETAGRHQFSP